jgi:spore coat polysaccharide biosynthesis protein SpsF
MKDIIGLVAVRTQSTRLKNKAFCKISGKPILEILIDRLKETSYLNDFIICTTVLPADDTIEEFCRKSDVKCFRGENVNVLKRFVDASRSHPSNFVVRITGDNPLTDFITMHQCFALLKKTGADYSRPIGIPLGTASEVIKTDALYALYERSLTPELSEYMTYFFELAPFIQRELFQVGESIYMPDLRLTIDYEGDLISIENLVKQFNNTIPALDKIIAYFKQSKDYPKFMEDSAKANEIKSKIKFK